MEALCRAFDQVQSPSKEVRLEGELQLSRVPLSLFLDVLRTHSSYALQSALYLKVRKPPIAVDLASLLLTPQGQSIEGKVRNVLDELLASLLFQQWPQNAGFIGEVVRSRPVVSTHVAVIKTLSRQKTQEFYALCEETTTALIPTLGSSLQADLLFSHAGKYAQSLPTAVYLSLLSAISQDYSLSDRFKSLLIKRIALYPSDMLGVYPALIDFFRDRYMTDQIYAFRVFSAILASPIFAPSGLILDQAGDVYPSPFFLKISENALLELIDFAIKSATLTEDQVNDAEEMLQTEEFEHKKYDLRPCAAHFLTVLYENCDDAVQRSVQTAAIGVLLSPLDESAALESICKPRGDFHCARTSELHPVPAVHRPVDDSLRAVSLSRKWLIGRRLLESAANWQRLLSVAARDAVLRLAFEALSSLHSSAVVSSALDFLVLHLSAATLGSEQYSALLQALLKAVNSCKALTVVRKSLELLGVVVDKWTEASLDVSQEVLTCIASVWKASFSGFDEDVQLKVAALTALLHAFRRFPLAEALADDLFAVIEFALDPLQPSGVHLRDVRTTQGGLMLLMVILQNSHFPICRGPRWAQIVDSVAYFLQSDRDLMELCLVVTVEVARVMRLHYQQEGFERLDRAISTLVADVNEAALRSILHCCTLLTYVSSIPLPQTIQCLSTITVTESETKHCLLHFLSRSGVPCLHASALFLSEANSVPLTQFLDPPEAPLQFLERLAVLRAVDGLWVQSGEAREASRRWIPEKCATTQISVPFRVFEYEEGEWEEFANFGEVCKCLNQSFPAI